jgi:import inner membrane translocase subunit TIM13
MNENCYRKCITKPSTSLSSSEEACLSRCQDRFLEAFNVVSTTYVARLAKERQAEGALAGAVGGGALPALGDQQVEYI